MFIRIILTILCFWAFNSYAQPGYTPINQRYNWLAGQFKSLNIPAKGANDTTLNSGQSTMAGAVLVDSVNHVFYFYSGGMWRRVSGGSGPVSDSNIVHKKVPLVLDEGGSYISDSNYMISKIILMSAVGQDIILTVDGEDFGVYTVLPGVPYPITIDVEPEKEVSFGNVTNELVILFFEDNIDNIAASEGGGGGGGGSGPTLTATNGIRKEGTVLKLGNELNDDVIFDDQRTTKVGLQYADDYSATFTDRSLIDKGTVIAMIEDMMPKVNIPLSNFEGDTDMAYPLGIFSPTTNTYLGTAYNDTDAFNLLSANSEVVAKGKLISVSGGVGLFLPKIINDLPSFYGLEYYVYTSHDSNFRVDVDDTVAYVRYGSTVVKSTEGTLTSTSSVNEYNGTWGIELPVFNFYRVTTSTSAGDSIFVYHNRRQKVVGHYATTATKYLGGILPKKFKYFQSRTQYTDTLMVGVTNLDECDSMLTYSIGNFGGGTSYVGSLATLRQPPSSVEKFGIHQIWNNTSGGIFGIAAVTWLTATNFPNVKSISGDNANPALLPASTVVSWVATMPLCTEVLNMPRSPGGTPTNYTSTDADSIVIAVATRLASVIPTGEKKMVLGGCSTRTSASDAAYNTLTSNGWTITY